MRRQQLPLYALALAILVVGLAAVGVPVSTLLVALLVLACPLMMFFMMAGGHGGPGDHDHQSGSYVEQHRDEQSTTGRR